MKHTLKTILCLTAFMTLLLIGACSKTKPQHLYTDPDYRDTFVGKYACVKSIFSDWCYCDSAIGLDTLAISKLLTDTVSIIVNQADTIKVAYKSSARTIFTTLNGVPNLRDLNFLNEGDSVIFSSQDQYGFHTPMYRYKGHKVR